MKNLRKLLMAGLCLGIICGMTGCGKSQLRIEKKKYPDAVILELNQNQAKANGKEIEQFDYTWHCDPSQVHDEVENAPAEYYTGTKPETGAGVYIDQELYYYPLLDEDKFQKVNYDGEQEWAYYYNDGKNDDYIFATLPNLGNGIPAQMMHSEEEAAANKVLHITQPGTYVLVGEWNGQINVDCGEDAYEDENAKVTLILDGATVSCTVAPGIIFKNVYECDHNWEDTERTDATIQTIDAGANLIIADGSQNHISGANVFRMLKTKYKDDESTDEIKLQKKLRKTDGALYSYMTMNIDGEKTKDGGLFVNSSFEGIDSELHLNVKGGSISINSQDDGMNGNEDHVSVVAFTGGTVNITVCGAEGDGVDSNGYILVDGGTILVNGVRVPDSALDSEDGVYYKSGSVIIDSVEQKYEPDSVFKETRMGGDFPGGDEFPGRENPGDKEKFEGGPKNPGDRMPMPQDFDIKEFKEKVAGLSDDATFEDVMELLRKP